MLTRTAVVGRGAEFLEASAACPAHLLLVVPLVLHIILNNSISSGGVNNAFGRQPVAA